MSQHVSTSYFLGFQTDLTQTLWNHQHLSSWKNFRRYGEETYSGQTSPVIDTGDVVLRPSSRLLQTDEGRM